MRNILSIVPAQPGWRAAYERPGKTPTFTQIACWALVEEDGERFVVGMDAAEFVGFCSDEDNFMFYLAPGESWENEE